MDMFIIGSAAVIMVVFANLLRNAWWEAYPPVDRDAETWNPTLKENDHG